MDMSFLHNVIHDTHSLEAAEGVSEADIEFARKVRHTAFVHLREKLRFNLRKDLEAMEGTKG